MDFRPSELKLWQVELIAILSCPASSLRMIMSAPDQDHARHDESRAAQTPPVGNAAQRLTPHPNSRIGTCPNTSYAARPSGPFTSRPLHGVSPLEMKAVRPSLATSRGRDGGSQGASPERNLYAVGMLLAKSRLTIVLGRRRTRNRSNASFANYVAHGQIRVIRTLHN